MNNGKLGQLNLKNFLVEARAIKHTSATRKNCTQGPQGHQRRGRLNAYMMGRFGRNVTTTTTKTATHFIFYDILFYTTFTEI